MSAKMRQTSLAMLTMALVEAQSWIVPVADPSVERPCVNDSSYYNTAIY